MADSALRVKLAIQMFEPSAVLPFENSAVGKENSFCFFEFSFGEKGSLEAIFPSHLALSFSIFGQAAIDMVRTQIKKKGIYFLCLQMAKKKTCGGHSSTVTT
ncbi:hypothetical protein OUZ56_027790 [Daphnia magna]|uniref:Uncharacterized protein n=1 Tax=Daphnia magna TaxID=35525 RepID=A0ABR0B1Y0_9CRUS|nr:hypothetical protein OUZ56_027790 [Daphnia magna]